MDTTYYIDRDPRPKTRPCYFCARDVESQCRCTCAPSQPRSEPLTAKAAGKANGEC